MKCVCPRFFINGRSGTQFLEVWAQCKLFLLYPQREPRHLLLLILTKPFIKHLSCTRAENQKEKEKIQDKLDMVRPSKIVYVPIR